MGAPVWVSIGSLTPRGEILRGFGASAYGGRSSAGRAAALQAAGRRFEPVRLHQPRIGVGEMDELAMMCGVRASSSVG